MTPLRPSLLTLVTAPLVLLGAAGCAVAPAPPPRPEDAPPPAVVPEGAEVAGAARGAPDGADAGPGVTVEELLLAGPPDDETEAAAEEIEHLSRTPWEPRGPHVDPVPLDEDFRIPVLLDLSPEGVAILRDADGDDRVAIFALGTSQDGPTFVGYMRVTF